MRSEYRNFRSDRIRSLVNTGQNFEPRSKLSLEEYFKSEVNSNPNLIRVVVLFDKSGVRGQKLYGCISQEELEGHMRCIFLMDNLDYFARWILMFGEKVVIEQPEELKERMAVLTKQLYNHYRITQTIDS